MKKLALIIAAFVGNIALLNAASVRATDVTGIDNTIYGIDATTDETGAAVMSVCLKNSISVPSYQFDIVIPEGFEVMTDGGGNYLISLSQLRTNSSQSFVLLSALQTDGCIRVVCYSSINQAFSGNDGEVCTIKFQKKAETLAGTYDVKFTNIVISDPDGNEIEPDSTTAILTIPKSSGAELIGCDALAKMEIFGVDGGRRTELQKGVNIIRYSNGTIKKVLVR